MQSPRLIHRFGPFELDPERYRLTRDRKPVWLQPRALEVLAILAANAGRIVTKRELSDRIWPNVPVSDNNIVQMVRQLRSGLGQQPDGTPYIDTLVRKGYRLDAAVETVTASDGPEDPRVLLAPILAVVNGRRALETLDRGELAQSRRGFEQILSQRPASAHLGLANIGFLEYESTRVDAPDAELLRQTLHHATEACRLNPSTADAWSTFAIVQDRCGATLEAVAAARHAVSLEPGSALHYLRYAAVSWGEERLRAALTAQAISPGLALAHWFAATVFVARGLFDRALQELRAGCEAQDAQGMGRLPAVGLHWLLGLVLAATGAVDEALAEFERELAFEDSRHVYAREACANSWYAIGALHLWAGRSDEARAAFGEALKRVPGHRLALVGLNAGSKDPAYVRIEHRRAPLYGAPDLEAAIAEAAAHAVRGEHQDAARVCLAAVNEADAGSAGWLLPVEPLLRPFDRPEVWAPVLARHRACAV